MPCLFVCKFVDPVDSLPICGIIYPHVALVWSDWKGERLFDC